MAESQQHDGYDKKSKKNHPYNSLQNFEQREHQVGFFLNQTATPEIYTLSLHDALPIRDPDPVVFFEPKRVYRLATREQVPDRKSTRLNSSHRTSSYAVFCLKKNNPSNNPEPNVQLINTNTPSISLPDSKA